MKPVTQKIVQLAFAALAVVAVAAPTDEGIDVSHIVDQAQAASILGEPVKPLAPRNMHGDDGYYSKCNYYSAKSKKTLIIRVYQAGAGFDPQKELDAISASTGTGRALSGLGDKAQLFSGTENGLPAHVTMLYVIKGTALVTVGLSGVDEEDAMEKAKTLAQKVLGQLP